MSILEAIILGIIQGLTEFLPVSSSGHLALGHIIFGLEEEGLLFTIAIHVATLIPVMIVFRKDIWTLIKQPFQKMTFLLIIATIPAALVGFLLRNVVETAFSSLQALAVGFIITGLVMTLSDKLRKNTKKSEDITYLDAALIGTAQAAALLPGISRSGSTISASLARGITRESAAKFSFLMSIPAILGGAALEIITLIQSGAGVSDISPIPLASGFLAAAFSGYLAVNFMLAAIKKAKLRYFAYYVLTLSAVIIFGLIALNW